MDRIDTNLFEELKNSLKPLNKYFSSDNILLRNLVIEDCQKNDETLIKVIINNNRLKSHFFTNVDDVLIFDKDKFIKLVSNKEFLPDSYTSFKQKIGLIDSNNQFISSRNDVVLSFPYKDCVLEGGQTKEDQKKSEIFYNEILAPDDIDCLLAPKVFTNVKRYSLDGEKETYSFNENDNLLIKGNNLLVLSSLLERYKGKVKLIYIDPPYNTGNDSFGYNDSFNHSTWLTFIKNRLSNLYCLLKDDGIICVQCDDNEQAYLQVIMNEIFERENHINTIVVKMSELKGFKMGNLTKKFPKLKEYLLIYAKNKDLVNLNIEKIKKDNLSNYMKYYNKRIININDAPEKWEVEKVDYSDEQKIEHANEMIYIVKRDAKIDVDLPVNQFVKYNSDVLFNNGQSIHTVLFLNNYMFEPLGDIWTDISTINLNKETNYNLYNGQKPIKLLKRIISSFTEEHDLVLDCFSGSGTTLQASLQLNRHFIGIEQLHDHINKSLNRLSKESFKNNSESFIYCELKELNQLFIKEIQNAGSDTQLIELYEQITHSNFISTKVNPKTLDENTTDFQTLSIENKRKLLIQLLDLNMLYVNYSDIDDNDFNISEQDKLFNKSFYGE